jgi:uncharacterized DUF497 family protein
MVDIYMVMLLLPERFPGLTGFQWDDGNSQKNWLAHDVSQGETEQVFLNRPVLVTADRKHSTSEVRHFALGVTNAGRRLTVVFTIRGALVRPIMARDKIRAERRIYGRQANAEEYEDEEA